jgi:polysaccharide pyruvyl transferase WcaK-like protein
MPRPGQRVLLLGGDADHNIGDRAILAALVRGLVAHDAGTLVATVGDPGRNGHFPGVSEVIPRGPRGLAALLAAARRADRILIAGGGLFQDDDSRAKMPYWAARIALLRSCNPRIAGFAIGAGPLDHPESRLAARAACAMLTHISARDRLAQAALAPCTDRPIDLVPDPAFMLEAASRDEAAALIERAGLPPSRPLVVATLRRWYHERGGLVPNGVKERLGIESRRDHARFEGMIGVVAKSLETIARRLDATILLLPGYNVGHEADDAACEALMWRMTGATVRMARTADPRVYKAILGRASLVISARMHPLILAAGMDVPFVGLSYNPKFDGLYELLGLDARSLPLDQCPDVWGESTLLAAADAALAARAGLRQKAETLASSTRRALLAAVFDERPAHVMETVDA